jgi:peptidoglycan/LPS O-acetylase OafA/YrhL
MGLLRVLLALSVASIHFGGFWGYRLGSGAAAVEAFFVISGFYMYLVLHEKYYASGIKSFYLARYLRLAPSYFAIVALTLVALAATGATHRWSLTFDETLAHFATASLPFQAFVIISNLTIFFSDFQVLLAFDGRNAWWAADFRQSPIEVYRFMIVPQGWSLGNELWFYLIAPFVLRKLWRILAVIALSLCVVAFLHFNGFIWDPWAHRFTPSVMHMFLMGSLACWAWKRWFENARWLPYVGAAGLALLALALITWWQIPLAEPDRRHFFVWATALLVGPIFSLTRSSKLDERLGELSYPIYVSHILALLIAGWALPGPDVAALALAITLGLSLALVYLVERPVDGWRHRLVAAGRSA